MADTATAQTTDPTVTSPFQSFLETSPSASTLAVEPLPKPSGEGEPEVLLVPAAETVTPEESKPSEKAAAGTEEKPKTVNDEPQAKRYDYLVKKLNKVGRENGTIKAENDAMHQALASMRAELKQMNETLNPGTTVAVSTPESQQATLEATAKVQAATALAYRQYGKEKVDALIFAEDGPWRTFEKGHPWAFIRAVASANPIQEALDILEEQHTLDRWGRNPEAVLKKAEAELRPKISQEFAAQAKGLGVTPGAIPPGLSGVRGTGDKPATVPEGQSAFDLNTLSVT